MNNWKDTFLKDVVDKASTGLDAIKRAPIVLENTGIRCLRIQDISQKKSYNTWGFTNVSNHNLSKFQLKKDDIIIARTGATIGVNKYISEDKLAVFNNGLIRLRVKKNICNSKYLFYVLSSKYYKDYIESISGGTSTQPNMQIGVLLTFDFLLPSLAEQEAIAEVLSSLDDKIGLLHLNNKTLEKLAETLFRHWFGEDLSSGNNVGKLGHLINLNYGKALQDERRDGSTYPVIGSSGVVGFHSDFLVKGPGIVIGRKGTLGKVIMVYDNFYPIDTTYYVTSKIHNSSLYFEYFLLKEMKFEEHNSDSAVPGLNRDIALSLEINLPNEEKVISFDKMVKPMFDKIYKNKNQISKLEVLRDLILPKLMNQSIKINE